MLKFSIVVPIFLLVLGCSIAKAQPVNEVAENQLAFQYFQNKEYEKAVVIYQKLFGGSNSKLYFSSYLKCLIELKQWEEGEKAIRKQMKQQKNDPTYLIELGYLYKLQQKEAKAKKIYEDAISDLKADKNKIRLTANAFVAKQEFDYALLTYQQAIKYTGEPYHFELANIYAYKRQYQAMIDQYLDLISKDVTQRENVQTRLQPYVTSLDNPVRQLLKTSLYKRIQQPTGDQTTFTEILVWLLIQEKDFESALVQVKALDRRRNESGDRVLEMADLAISNQAYDVATKAYEYVLQKGTRSPLYYQAKTGYLTVLYDKVEKGFVNSYSEIEKIETQYKETISEFGEGNSYPLILKLAHLQAYYLDKTQNALQLLEPLMQRRMLPDLMSQIKLEYADVLLVTGDIWEAALVYGQVENNYENSPIGAEARFRKSKLAYYQGNFKWAEAQLDILKASTSKLIANDACNLALLISDNTINDEDTTYEALQIYARAELLMLQYKDSLAILTLDTLLKKFSSHTLADEAIYHEGQIAMRAKKYDKAAEFYEKIAQNYASDILADDALWKLATLYDNQLKDKNKAMEYYKRILTDHGNSIYVVEARKEYRRLRGN